MMVTMTMMLMTAMMVMAMMTIIRDDNDDDGNDGEVDGGDGDDEGGADEDEVYVLNELAPTRARQDLRSVVLDVPPLKTAHSCDSCHTHSTHA